MAGTSRDSVSVARIERKSLLSTERFDDEQISHMIAFFADRLNLVFAHFFCTIEFNGDQDFSALPTQENLKDARILGLRTIRGACLHTTLIALRDLDDVLTPRKPNQNFRTTLRFLILDTRTL
jgi:hypothetical protein